MRFNPENVFENVTAMLGHRGIAESDKVTQQDVLQDLLTAALVFAGKHFTNPERQVEEALKAAQVEAEQILTDEGI